MFGTNQYNSLMFILIAWPKKTFISTLFCWIYCFTNAWPNHMTQSWNWSWEDLISKIFYWRSCFALLSRLWVKESKNIHIYCQQKNRFNGIDWLNWRYLWNRMVESRDPGLDRKLGSRSTFWNIFRILAILLHLLFNAQVKLTKHWNGFFAHCTWTVPAFCSLKTCRRC